jgi:poly(3-hydroxybutyrate) depolymerase
MLHGGFGNGAQAEHSYNWDSEADNGHFLVAYPDGLVRAWNAGSCCGEPQRTNADDVGFITAMVGVIEQQMPIDRARIYVTGMSNGAMMALRLGCQTDTFAAIAPVAGTLLSDCSAARPTSVLQIHGTADDRVPYNGGPGKAFTANGTARVDGPSVESVNATWRHRRVRGAELDHRRGRHHPNRRMPGRAHRRVDLGGRRGPSMARRRTQPPGGKARRYPRALDGPQRHRRHLAILHAKSSLRTGDL